MYDLRQDFLSGDYVAIAEARAIRPHVINEDICPFCESNFDMTPPSKYLSDDRRIRVFDNKYPALPPYSEAAGGFHEVVVDTYVHGENFTYFSDEHIAKLLMVIKYRVNFMNMFDKIKYVQVFKNNGMRSGASINHSHWQIVGMPVIPNKLGEVFAKQWLHYEKTVDCYLCVLKKEIIEAGENGLLVYENESAIAYAPKASAFFYEIDILTKKHISDIKDIDEEIAYGIAEALGTCVRALSSIFGNLDYNICVINQPYFELKREPFFHFYIRVIPRIGNFGGFELATGSYINSAFPEQAANNLRKAILSMKGAAL